MKTKSKVFLTGILIGYSTLCLSMPVMVNHATIAHILMATGMGTIVATALLAIWWRAE